MKFTEAQLKAAIIELLDAEGYPHVSEPRVRRKRKTGKRKTGQPMNLRKRSKGPFQCSEEQAEKSSKGWKIWQGRQNACGTFSEK